MTKDSLPVKRPSAAGVRQTAEGLAQVAAVVRAGTVREGTIRGLSGSQARALALLLEAPSGLRLSEVAGRLGVSPASASDTVAGLVSRRLVSRSRDPEDARAVRLITTARARKPDLGGAPASGLEEALSDLSPGDRATLHRSLVTLILALQKRGLVSVAQACVNCRYFKPRVHRSKVAPHHCDFVDEPFGDASLRFLCADFEAATSEAALQGQNRWLSGGPATAEP